MRGELFNSLVNLSLDFHSRQPRRRARVAPVVRRDAGPDDAHPDDDLAAVVAHRAHRVGRDPVHAQPDAPAHRAPARARRCSTVAIMFGRPSSGSRPRSRTPSPTARRPRRRRSAGSGSSRAMSARSTRRRATPGTCPGSSPRAHGSRCGGRGSAASWGSSGSARSPSCCGTRATRSSRAACRSGRSPGFLLYGITIGASLATIAGLYGQFREGAGAVRACSRSSTPADHQRRAGRGRRWARSPGGSSSNGVTFAYDGARAVAARRRPRRAGGRGARARRAVGLGQDDARRADPAAVGRDPRGRSGWTAPTSAT